MAGLAGLVEQLRESGSEQPAEEAELLVSEAAADLPSFLASTRLQGELLGSVRQCASHRVRHAPTVSFAALERARGTLEDFARTYLPLHGLDPFEFLRYMPALSFVEAAIYAADEENEVLAASGAHHPTDVHSQSEAAILGVLEARRWLHDDVRAHLRSGKAYWALERSICRAMLAGGRVSESDVLSAHELKSFDYRLLNALLYALRGVPPDPRLDEFLRVDEMLTDIADDLFDYEEDVVCGSFNVYRAFIYVHGAQRAQSQLAARISNLEAQHAVLLSALGQPAQRAYGARMDEVFSRPGTRSWQMPPPIVGEAEYRAGVLREEGSNGSAACGQRDAASGAVGTAKPARQRRARRAALGASIS